METKEIKIGDGIYGLCSDKKSEIGYKLERHEIQCVDATEHSLKLKTEEKETFYTYKPENDCFIKSVKRWGGNGWSELQGRWYLDKTCIQNELIRLYEEELEYVNKTIVDNVKRSHILNQRIDILKSTNI